MLTIFFKETRFKHRFVSYNITWKTFDSVAQTSGWSSKHHVTESSAFRTIRDAPAPKRNFNAPITLEGWLFRPVSPDVTSASVLCVLCGSNLDWADRCEWVELIELLLRFSAVKCQATLLALYRVAMIGISCMLLYAVYVSYLYACTRYVLCSVGVHVVVGYCYANAKWISVLQRVSCSLWLSFGVCFSRLMTLVILFAYWLCR